MSEWKKPDHLRLDIGLIQDNEPVLIYNKIWIGSLRAAYNLDALKKSNVTHVLNISGEMDAQWNENFQYLFIDLRDKANSNLLSCIPTSNMFIEAGVKSGGIFVHCRGGKSRSPALIIAYLMTTLRWTFKKSLAHLVERRPIVELNTGFRHQLIAYQKCREIYRAQQMVLLRRIYNRATSHLQSAVSSSPRLDSQWLMSKNEKKKTPKPPRICVMRQNSSRRRYIPPLRGMDVEFVCRHCREPLFFSSSILRHDVPSTKTSKRLDATMPDPAFLHIWGDATPSSESNSPNTLSTDSLPEVRTRVPPTRRNRDRGTKGRRFDSSLFDMPPLRPSSRPTGSKFSLLKDDYKMPLSSRRSPIHDRSNSPTRDFGLGLSLATSRSSSPTRDFGLGLSIATSRRVPHGGSAGSSGIDTLSSLTLDTSPPTSIKINPKPKRRSLNVPPGKSPLSPIMASHRPSTSPTRSLSKKIATKKVRRRKSTAGLVRRSALDDDSGSLSIDKTNRVHDSKIELSLSLNTDPSPSSSKIETESSLSSLTVSSKIEESSKKDQPSGISINTGGDLTLKTGASLTVNPRGGLKLNTGGLALNTSASVKSKEPKCAVLVPPLSDPLSESENAENLSPIVTAEAPAKQTHPLRVSVSEPVATSSPKGNDKRGNEGTSSPAARNKLRNRRQRSTFPAPARSPAARKAKKNADTGTQWFTSSSEASDTAPASPHGTPTHQTTKAKTKSPYKRRVRANSVNSVNERRMVPTLKISVLDSATKPSKDDSSVSPPRKGSEPTKSSKDDSSVSRSRKGSEPTKSSKDDSSVSPPRKGSEPLLYSPGRPRTNDQRMWVLRLSGALEAVSDNASNRVDQMASTDMEAAVLACDIMAVEPLPWMGDTSADQGALRCPNHSCQASLGFWNWNGTRCKTCAVFVKPAFFINKSAVLTRERISFEKRKKKRR